MSTTTFANPKTASSSKMAIAGAIAGLVGGVFFGIMMGMMGMLPMVGMLVRQENALVGFILHMVLSAFIGAVYGLIAWRFSDGWLTAVISGLVYGAIWWVLGALTLMPLLLGMTQMVFVIGTDQWLSLMGHIIYGLVTAFVFIPLAKRN
ncbi:MAG: hypothetical protein A2Z49_04875 [Chloroflexi bacterium RBG_19FT_COMBO_56_12]|nr:MAG: hypothetical protein A2Z49_04875 [Chloroflexi bacterium RBG_19FT_COMBO_56_12]